MTFGLSPLNILSMDQQTPWENHIAEHKHIKNVFILLEIHQGQVYVSSYSVACIKFLWNMAGK